MASIWRALGDWHLIELHELGAAVAQHGLAVRGAQVADLRHIVAEHRREVPPAAELGERR